MRIDIRRALEALEDNVDSHWAGLYGRCFLRRLRDQEW